MAEKTKNLKEKIVEILSEHIGKVEYKGVCTAENIDVFASYCMRLLLETDKKNNQPKHPFMKTKTPEALAQLFLRVAAEGLVFDGRHITLISRGISYDYIAYKNKMLLAYPESMIDMDVVKEGDTFTAGKESGKVVYSHKIADPLSTGDMNSIKGAYCVIQNKRGEFLTLLSKEDLAKHRKVAKTDSFWSQWFKEMVLKTVIKKATKYHFDDIFEGMNEADNESSIDLEKMNVPAVDQKKLEAVLHAIEGFKNLKALQDYYLGLAPEFIKNGDVFEAYNAQKEICRSMK